MNKEFIFKLIENYLKYKSNKFLCNQWKSNCLKNNIDPDKPAEGESDYLSLWRQLDKNVEAYSYRLFSHYMGRTPFVIPEILGSSMIERYLNPTRYRDFYCDKNLFGQIYGKENVAETVVARINRSCLLNGNLSAIPTLNKEITQLSEQDIAKFLEVEGCSSIVLKPSVDSCSGSGVMLFRNVGNEFISADGKTHLSGAFLAQYGDDFVIQRSIKQHPYISQFCNTSVNTIRISTYRSVKNEDIIVKGALMRVGASGSFVDNAHAGGRFVGINIEDGSLQKTTLDQYGTKVDVWNEVDFASSDYVIPHWDRIVDFAKKVAACNKHMRLLALDICLCEDGSPKLVR